MLGPFFALLLTSRACVGDPSGLPENSINVFAVRAGPLAFPVDLNPTASFAHVSHPLLKKFENPVKKHFLFGCG